MKTYQEWEGSLTTYLEAGDLVDEEMVQHFINVMPPATCNSRCIQIGEPYSHINGKAVFSTLMRTDEGWIYAGECYRGEITHIETDY